MEKTPEFKKEKEESTKTDRVRKEKRKSKRKSKTVGKKPPGIPVLVPSLPS